MNVDQYIASSHGSSLKGACSSFSSLPSYLSLDTPLVLRIRARLRFDVASLNVSLYKGHLAGSPDCAVCKIPESRSHVLLDCPRYNGPRSTLAAALPVHVTQSLTMPLILTSTSIAVAKFLLAIHTIHPLL